MNERQFAPATYNAAKTATKMLLGTLGGIDAAACCTRVRRSQLSDYGAPANETFMPIDIVLDLEKVAGTVHVTAALALAQGYTLLPTAVSQERGTLAVLLAAIGRDVGELFATAAVALTNEQMSSNVRSTLVRELDDLRRVAGMALVYLTQDAA